MNFSLLYWILMLIWAIFGLFNNWPSATATPGTPRAAAYGPFGGTLLLFVLLCLLGWHDFGAPVHP